MVVMDIKLQSKLGKSEPFTRFFDLFATVLHSKSDLAHTRAAALILAAPLSSSVAITFHVNNVLVLHVHAKRKNKLLSVLLENQRCLVQRRLCRVIYLRPVCHPNIYCHFCTHPIVNSWIMRAKLGGAEHTERWMCNFGVWRAKPCLACRDSFYTTLIHTWRNSHPVWTTWLLQ